MSKRFVAYLASFLGVSFYLKTTDPRVSRAIDVLYGKKLQRLIVVDDKVFEDYVLCKMTAWYVTHQKREGRWGRKEQGGRGRRRPVTGDGEDGGVEYEDVAQLQPSDWD